MLLKFGQEKIPPVVSVSETQFYFVFSPLDHVWNSYNGLYNKMGAYNKHEWLLRNLFVGFETNNELQLLKRKWI